MPQIFQPRTNTLVRAGICGVLLLVAGLAWGLHTVYWSPYTTRVNVPVEQIVPFSHKHHAGGIGIDCRYCHSSVETSAFAGMPATETCMTCHSQLWIDAPMLAPVRQSLISGKPLAWRRVNDLPDFVYFNHSIHISKGIGCSSCHGPVDQMPVVWQANTFYMKWCLDCHRQPEKFIRERSEVFNMTWSPPANQQSRGRDLAADYHVRPLTDCSICHR